MVNKIPDYYDRNGDKWSIKKGDWKSHQPLDRIGQIKKKKKKTGILIIVNITLIIIILIFFLILKGQH